MLLPSPFLRIAVVVGLCLALQACGRRGALEAPPDPSAPQQSAQAPVAGEEDEGFVPSANPNAQRKRPRGLVIPKEPFVLDPLL